MALPRKQVLPIHFEDYDGTEFERLVFAYHLRRYRWRTLEWYGQTGSDLGRDILGILDDDSKQGERICIQCANRTRLTFQKAANDVDKASGAPSGRADRFRLVCSSNVSATLRDRLKAHALKKSISDCEVWSGAEFEERLRRDAESLLKRFVDGVSFPDDPKEIRKFVANISPASDSEILALMAGLFDRPAFYTPFNQESSIPAFKKAITDTIEALNTGIHRLRDGTEIRRIPSRHQVKDPHIRTALAQLELMLCRLRAQYDSFMKSRDIRPCGCADADCQIFFISAPAARTMDQLRTQILDGFRRLCPLFRVQVGWRNH